MKTQRHTDTEAENRVRLLQAKECLGLQEARKDPALEDLEESWPCQHLNFRLLVSRIVRHISVVLNRQFVAFCYENARKLV